MNRSKRLKQAFTFAVIGACLTFPALAQGNIPGDATEVPSQAKGINGNSAFEFGDLGTVNLLNGNLSLSLPLGLSYPVGPSLSYQFVLNYNSQVWDYQTEECQADADGGGPGTSNTPLRFSVPVPDPLSNAGIGWTLSFGRLLQPADDPVLDATPLRPGKWTYVSPDGSRHGFSGRLGGETGPTGASYTNGGTFLRMRNLCSNDPGNLSCGEREVDFPDGTIKTFANFGTSATPDWRLTQIRDPFDGFIYLTYNGRTWTISDSHTRMHVVTFSDSSFTRIDKITLQDHAFTNGTEDYFFEYIPDLTSKVDRHRYSSLLANTFCDTPEISEIPNTSPDLLVDLLARVTRPEGSFFDMGYYLTDSALNAKSGALKSLQIPTGATYEWKYGVYPFSQYRPPTELVNGFPPSRFGAGSTWGVVEKRRYQNLAGGEVEELGTWTYQRFSINYQNNNTGQTLLCTIGNRVTDPKGFVTESYFNILEEGTDALFEFENASFTLCDPETINTISPDPPYLSQRMFEDGVLVRSIFLDYESDGLLVPRFERDLRIIHRQTVFNDDGYENSNLDFIPYEINETYSNYDGFGNFRSRTRSSTFPEGTIPNHTFTNYNSAFGYGDPFRPDDERVIPDAEEKWLLQDFTFQEVSQGADRSLAKFCFDPGTGALLGERRLKDQAQNPGFAEGPEDVLVLSRLDTSGFPEEITYYGGDDSPDPVANGDLCGTAATSANQIVQSHSRGVLAQSSFVDCNGNEVSRRLKNAIDPTGLLTNTDDEANIRTVFRYDQGGRLVCSSKTGEVEMWNRYHFPASVGELARLESYSCPSNSSGCSAPCAGSSYLTHQETHFDGLGRPTLEQRRMPLEDGDAWVERAMRYDELGRMSRQSVWVPQGAANLPADPDEIPTSAHTPHRWYRNYDRFGRVGRIENPDRSFLDFSYKGSREVVSTVAIGQDAVPSERTEIRDGHGRLIVVSEASGTGTTPTHTTYRYDHEGRLERACVNDDDTRPQSCPTSGTQRRIFDYDGRGWLSRENHPELGNTANGMVSYTYDALGNVILRDAPGSSSDLTHVYDRAGRLTQVCVDADSNGHCMDSRDRLLKELFYGREVAGTTRNRGKLVVAKRHNWVRTAESPDIDTNIVVTENFAYTQRSGKLSKYQVRSSGGPAFGYQILVYDDLGNIQSLEYPECVHGACEIGAGNTQTYTYTRGLLSQIPGVASALAYHPNGQVAKVDHSNGTSDRRELDTLGWRLRSISLQDSVGTPLWDTGSYTYDAAGNILGIGLESFDYDQVDRLTESSVRLPNGSAVTQALTYDVFGNLTTVSTPNHGVLFLAPSAASNRLDGAGYDARGNVTSITIDGSALSLAYDPFNRMKSSEEEGGAQNSFLYTASDERFAVLNPALGDAGYTIRGPDSQVLTRARQLGTSLLTRHKDYIYGGSVPVAVESDAGLHHIHVDHLGTTRRITDDSMPVQVVEATTLYPFGGYTDLPIEGSEELLFTGHERDSNSANPDAALDYMHARYYSAHLGRFLSIDPAQGRRELPQSWNRYAYVLNSPISLLDPNGLQDASAPVESPSCDGTPDWLGCTGQATTATGDGLARVLELSGKGLLNFMEGAQEVSRFLNDSTFGLLGLHGQPGAPAPEVEGGEIVQGVGNGVAIAAATPGLVLSGLNTTGGFVGGAQALGGTGIGIGNLGFTTAAGRTGLATLSVPRILYTGTAGGAQQGFLAAAGMRHLATGAPIILGPAGPITVHVEIPFLLGIGAKITHAGGLPK